MRALVSMYTGFLCITASIGKSNTFYHYPPLPPLVSGMTGQAVWPIYIHLASHNYLTCISYNFFIFCPICLKFSHKFLHTYSFILSIKKQNWKIIQFWVVDPLNLALLTRLYAFAIRDKNHYNGNTK